MQDPFSAQSLSARPGHQWLAAMEAIAEEDGYLDPLGPGHWAFFAETGTSLIVTFERAEAIRAREGNMPAGWALAQQKGWSFLCLIAEGETFWRAPEVWGWFDRLVDDAFFDDFDRVLFCGAGAAGYAAASYVVAAPGARALLIAPRATMAPEIAGWDRRHLGARRLDFTSRYGYAPDMTEGAEKVWLVFDPLNPPDCAHAALFRRPWVTPLHTRWTGELPERHLASAGVLDSILAEAMEGRLTPAGFAAHWRARRDSAVYLRALLTTAAGRGRPGLEEAICRSATQRLKAPRFARRLAEIAAAREADAREAREKAEASQSAP